jgi:hypothetical protein
MTDSFNMRAAMSRLKHEHLVVYLEANNWEVASCEHEGRMLFVGDEHEHGRYELVLPEPNAAGNHRTLLQRAIYKLCGIEDREPSEILGDVFAEFARLEAAPAPPTPRGQLVRIRNSGRTTLRVRISSRRGEHELLPQEAVEVTVQSPEGRVPEFEHHENLLIIRDQ